MNPEDALREEIARITKRADDLARRSPTFVLHGAREKWNRDRAIVVAGLRDAALKLEEALHALQSARGGGR